MQRATEEATQFGTQEQGGHSLKVGAPGLQSRAVCMMVVVVVVVVVITDDSSVARFVVPADKRGIRGPLRPWWQNGSTNEVSCA
eukprot:838905-Pelagomonas_calceolata.AAC.1